MTVPTISWVHIGDLHMDEADGWHSRDRLAALAMTQTTVGAWLEHGIEGTQLGPNKNGMHW